MQHYVTPAPDQYLSRHPGRLPEGFDCEAEGNESGPLLSVISWVRSIPSYKGKHGETLTRRLDNPSGPPKWTWNPALGWRILSPLNVGRSFQQDSLPVHPGVYELL